MLQKFESFNIYICTEYLHDYPIPSMNESILNIHLVTLKLICIDQIAVLYSEKRHTGNYNSARSSKMDSVFIKENYS